MNLPEQSGQAIQKRRCAWMIGVALLLLAALGVIQDSPRLASTITPSHVPVGGSWSHLERIAAESRAVGTAGHDRARTYLLAQLESLGLHPQIQESLARDVSSRTTARIENIVVRIEGTRRGNAVLMAAHYDSVFNGPGCADDAAAVAALLELARLVLADRPLRNDLILLFTDGEELGLLGARAFVNEHPWMNDVGVVFNFDAGGVSGPLVMWETTAGDAWVVREYSRAVPFAVAGSWSSTLSRRNPMGTDFHVLAKGRVGLGFGFAEDGFTRYHRVTDSVEALDRNTLLHMEQTMVALARHFGNLDAPRGHGADAVYVSVFGRVVAYSRTVAWMLLGVTGVLCVLVMVSAYRLRQMSFRRMLLVVVALPVVMATSGVLVFGVWWGVRYAQPLYYANYPVEGYNAECYAMAFLLFALAVSVAMVRCAVRRLGETAVAGSLCATWTILASVTTAKWPGFSYLFTWPAAAMCLATLARAHIRRQSALTGTLVLLSIPACLLLVPWIAVIRSVAGLEGAPAIAALIVLGYSALMPQSLDVVRVGGFRFVGVLALMGAAAIGAGAATSGFDAGRPDCDTIEYALNQDTREARWFTALEPRQRSPWLMGLVGVDAPKGSVLPFHGAAYAASAPGSSGEPIEVTVVADARDPETRVRRLTFLVRGLPMGNARVTIDNVTLTHASVMTREIPLTDGHLDERVAGFPDRPLTFTVSTTHDGPLEVAIETWVPLQNLPGVSVPSRPQSARACGDRAFIHRRVVL
jgi:hypothetical protein